MTWLLKTSLAAGAVMGATLLFAGTAEAATFRCSAFATVNDFGPGGDNTFNSPCSRDAATTGGFGATQVSAFVSADLGVLKASSGVSTTDHVFASASTYGFVGDGVTVSGLGDEGANLVFRVALNGSLSAEAAQATQFSADTAMSEFYGQVDLSSTRGLGSTARRSGCVRGLTSGISVCNGDFDYGVSTAELVDDVMLVAIHVWNGDVLNIGLQLHTSSLGHTPIGFANTGADFAHTMYWDGLVFDDASRNVVLTSASGFDYRYSAFPDTGGAVPEPATWALMIAGFGLAGSALRRRRHALA